MAGGDEADLDHEQIAIKDKLKNLLFTGSYSSKDYVRSLASYRDVITVTDEAFAVHLEYVKARLEQLQRQRLSPPTWIGATVQTKPTSAASSLAAGRSSSYYSCWTIWTELPAGTPLGDYRFKVKTIRWRPNEIIIKVRIVDEPQNRRQSAGAGDAAATDTDTEWWSQPQMIGQQCVLAGREAWTQVCAGGRQFREWIVSREYSWTNAYLCLKYVAYLVFLLAVLAIRLVDWLGRFALRLQSELRLWCIALTPLALSIVNLVQKCIGGLLILVSMVWGDVMRGGGHVGGRPMIEPRYERQQYRPRYR